MPGARPRGTDKARLMEVIETQAIAGDGLSDEDYVRRVKQYWDKDGTLLATSDYLKPTRQSIVTDIMALDGIHVHEGYADDIQIRIVKKEDDKDLVMDVKGRRFFIITIDKEESP